MKTLSVISLSIILAACGGESDSSNNISGQLERATYELALGKCGDGLPLNISDHTVAGSGENYILVPAENAELYVEGTGHEICIGGDMNILSVSGSGNNVYVSGSVSTLVVRGVNSDIFIFGDALSADMSGTGNDVYVKTVATYEDTGTNNGIMNISNAKL